MPQPASTFPTVNANDYEDPENLIAPTSSKQAWIAVVLNVLWAGLGQIYLGQWKSGVLIAFFNFIAIFTTVGLGYFVAVCFTIYRGVRDANRLNRGEPIDQWGRIPTRRTRVQPR